ncbi:hypothetical protein FKF97_10475 [Clostridium perfringens]|nr:hypothetical protein [Clostridium perfringens]
MWTSKLWGVSDKNGCTLYVIACNEEHLLLCFNKEYDYEFSYFDFKEEFYSFELTRCGDFDIVVK